MKSSKSTAVSVILAFLLVSTSAPLLMTSTASAQDAGDSNGLYSYAQDGSWWKLETDLITILFPSNGKPMFLWWYSNDTSKVYVVKYRGLIEYMMLDSQYYAQKYEANALTVQERMMDRFGTFGNMIQRRMIQQRIKSAYAMWLLDFHPSFLPFKAARWNLTGPIEVNGADGVSYVSFNFTLVDAPPAFDFAEGNVVIRCRFYATAAKEDVYGLYEYTVNPGELKMDLVIKNWNWNIDKLNDFFSAMHTDYGISAPSERAGLALWADVASINVTKIPIAEEDANSVVAQVPETSALAASEPVELNSDTSDIIAGGQRIQVKNAGMGDTSPFNLGNGYRSFRLRFAEGSKTLAGFFDFVNAAVVVNPSTQEKSIVNVTAAYIPAGNHLRLFLGYPYFGANTLEHDPSIGVEGITPWLPFNVLFLLIGATGIIALAIVAVRLRKKTVNIVGIH